MQRYKSDVMFVKKGISEVLPIDFAHSMSCYLTTQFCKFASMTGRSRKDIRTFLLSYPRDFVD